jgi:hypothetical protein
MGMAKELDMQIGSLVKLIFSRYDGYGVITHIKDWPNSNSVWYTVHWQNGQIRSTYEADELEVICR